MRKLLRKTRTFLLVLSSILFLILLFNPPEQPYTLPTVQLPPKYGATPPNSHPTNLTPPLLYLCPFKLPASARLGNDLFVFSSLYGLARKFNGKVLMPEVYASRLKKFFKLSSIVTNFPTDTPSAWLPRGLKERRAIMKNDADVMCDNGWKRFTLERWASGYDDKVVRWIRSKLASVRKHPTDHDSKKNIEMKNNISEFAFTSNEPPIPILGVGRYLQSFKYFEAYKEDLLTNQIAFHDWLTRRASRIIRLAKLQNSQKMRDPITVGVHIRRGDMADKGRLKQGYTVANEDYFKKSIEFYASTFRNQRLLFIVATDDLRWARRHFRPLGHAVVFTSDFVDLNFLETQDGTITMNVQKVERVEEKSKDRLEIEEEELKMKFSDIDSLYSVLDLAILSMTDHSLLSVGSYGWWGGYLSRNPNRKVVYFSNYPKPNSEIASTFISSDYHPPSWIRIP